MNFGTISGLNQNQSYDPSQNSIGKDFKTLADSLKSGDLSAAKEAYNKIQKEIPSDAKGKNSQLDGAFSALGKALDSGNVNDAQAAFTKFQQTAKSAQPSNFRMHIQDNDGDGNDSADTSSTTGSGVNVNVAA